MLNLGVIAYASHNLAAVHLRHLYVGEHDVGSRVRGNGYCLAGVYGRGGVEADALDALQHLREELTLQAVVVYYHHG